MKTALHRLAKRCVAMPNGCIEFHGAPGQGYGRIAVVLNGKKRMMVAHRVAYMARHGLLPVDVLVLHKCDNRACIRDEHLFTGTHLDNMRDMAAKGRAARGEARPNAKLQTSVARQILEDQRSQSTIAREYGVDQSLISRIKSGKKWKWLREGTAR